MLYNFFFRKSYRWLTSIRKLGFVYGSLWCYQWNWRRVSRQLLFVGNIEYAWDIIDVGLGFQFMVFNATFNNISVILWLLVLLVSGESHWPIATTSYWQTLSHKVVLSTQSRKLAPDRWTVSDKFPGGPVVFVNSPDRLSGKLLSAAAFKNR